MTRIDLRDAYYLIAVKEEHRKFLRFKFEGVVYEFTCLVFGLNVAPWIFIKILKPALAFLRAQGLRSVVHLDDILLIGSNYEECRNNFVKTRQLLSSLGFVIHNEKSDSVPKKIRSWLGFIFNSKDMTLDLPPAKKEQIIRLIDCSLPSIRI
ncbi:hypothetical protein TKK_0018234 [Trichogramma kaykai]